MLHIGSVVWGVRDLPRATAFWSAALNYRLRGAPDVDWAVLVPREGVGVQLVLSVATSEKARRHHLDLYAADQAAEVERLLALGATWVDWKYPPGADFVVLADPDGNRFCVIQVEGLPAWLTASGVAQIGQDKAADEGNEP
ncbi:VOC family protein [Deinococcus cavernae]|uniref:VOC family protein n=1 Tax=Deinococcus cavernae TaxID=2320857 RepID=UPI001313E792|nr:VOC family protein [Deinococcus cavernae]